MATKRPRAEEEKVWDAFQNCWTINGEPVANSNESDGEEFVSLKERRALREERLRKQRKRPVAEEEEPEPEPAPEPQQRALVDEAEDLRRQQQGVDKEKTKRAEEEACARWEAEERRRIDEQKEAQEAELAERRKELEVNTLNFEFIFL